MTKNDQEDSEFVLIPVYRTLEEQQALIRLWAARRAKDVTPKD